MPGLTPVFCLLLLAGSAAAQYRVAVPAKIHLAPSSLGTAAAVSMTMTNTALSPLLLPAASVKAVPAASLPFAAQSAPALARAFEPLSAASLPSDPVAGPAGGLGRMRAVVARARNWLLKPEERSGEAFYDGADPGRPEAVAALTPANPMADARGFWADVSVDARAEIEGLRERKLSKAAFEVYVRKESAAAFARVRAARGIGDIGFQFGDRASRFFQTPEHSPYDALDAGDGNIPFLTSRRGSALSVFAVDRPEHAAFLAPPVRVFDATAKKLGLRRLSRDEETLATVRFLEAALTGGGGAAARLHAAVSAAPLLKIPWLFKLKDGDYLYHGTTLEDLIRLVESGGEMTPAVSQYSLRADDSIMYAAGRRDKLGLPDNPAVLLQFRYDELRPMVSADIFKADVLASAAYGNFSLHAAYVAATKPVPLSMMTRESKDSLLRFIRAQEARRPDQPKWADLRAKFERILDGPAPRRQRATNP